MTEARGGSYSLKALKPFNAGEIKVLLLENINQSAVDILTKQGYQVRENG